MDVRYREDPDLGERICPTCGGLMVNLPVCQDLKHAVLGDEEPCWFLEKTLEGYREELALRRAHALASRSSPTAKGTNTSA